jgi:hypothetical protein
MATIQQQARLGSVHHFFFQFTSDSVVLFWTRSFDIHTARYSAFHQFPLSGWKETFEQGAGYGKVN